MQPLKFWSFSLSIFSVLLGDQTVRQHHNEQRKKGKDGTFLDGIESFLCSSSGSSNLNQTKDKRHRFNSEAAFKMIKPQKGKKHLYWNEACIKKPYGSDLQEAIDGDIEQWVTQVNGHCNLGPGNCPWELASRHLLLLLLLHRLHCLSDSDNNFVEIEIEWLTVVLVFYVKIFMKSVVLPNCHHTWTVEVDQCMWIRECVNIQMDN